MSQLINRLCDSKKNQNDLFHNFKSAERMVIPVTLRNFLDNQEKVYGEFRCRADKTKVSGIKIDHLLAGRRGGFFVNIIHSREFSTKAEALSRRIASTVPAIVYCASAIHTTLGCYKPAMGFVAKPGEPYFDNDLKSFAGCIRGALIHFDPRHSVTIDYDACLYNEEVVIAAGRPNQKFIDLVLAIQDVCAKRGLEVLPPWGAHSTLNRFTENVPPERLQDFFEIVDRKTDLGKSTALGIGIGYALWKSEEENQREKLSGHFFQVEYLPL